MMFRVANGRGELIAESGSFEGAMRIWRAMEERGQEPRWFEQKPGPRPMGVQPIRIEVPCT